MNSTATMTTTGGAPTGGSLRAATLIFRHTIWQLIWGKKLILVLFVTALPVVLAGLYETVIPARNTTAGEFFLGITMSLVIQLLLPLTAIAFAIGLVSDEVERGTLLYLFTRPIPKAFILLGKVAAYAVVSIGFGSLSLLATYAVMTTKTGAAESMAEAGGLMTVWPPLVLGMLAYGGLFVALGTWFRKPLILAVVFAFGWENLLGSLPGQTQLLAVLYYLRIMVSRASGEILQGTPFFVKEGDTVPSASMAAIILVGIFLVGVSFAIYAFKRQQYTMSRVG